MIQMRLSIEKNTRWNLTTFELFFIIDKYIPKNNLFSEVFSYLNNIHKDHFYYTLL